MVRDGRGSSGFGVEKGPLALYGIYGVQSRVTLPTLRAPLPPKLPLQIEPETSHADN